VDDPKPTYRAIFGAYWRRFACWFEIWWLGFSFVMVGICHAVYVARQPQYLPFVDQQTAATASVVLALIVFAATFYYEFL
jgi:hypothetical protein